jgi:hypothetical protein
MQYINLNELDWLRFEKIRLQEFYYPQWVFCLSYLIIMVEGSPNKFALSPKKPWDGPASQYIKSN